MTAPHAHLVEWGTVSAPAQPFLAPALRSADPLSDIKNKSGRMIGGGEVLSPEAIAAAGLKAATFAKGAVEGGLALMELMQQIPGSDPTREGAVHGSWDRRACRSCCDRADGVTVTRLKTWSDAQFRPIDPNAV